MAGPPPDDVIVRVSGVSKSFDLPHEHVHTLKERAVHPFRRRSFDRLHALRDVTFDVRKGESFGIVGRNGSGKSTLMKCLAGIYRADAGEMWLRGRLAPFIELGVGFNPDLTARDNVLVNAVMLGLTPAQARERYDSVIAFAELEEFQDLKLKNYSSGMQVRLAFSVMVHVDADLLLIDEVLAVGDAAFQAKCRDVLDDARRRGTTILLVTHDMSQIRRFCDRALLLDRGTQVAVGPAPDVARSYTQLNFAGAASEGSSMPRLDGAPTVGGATIVDAWAQAHGAATEVVAHGDEINLCIRVRFTEPTTAPAFAITVTDEDERVVFVASTTWAGTETGSYDAGEEVDVVVAMDNWLAAGRFVLTGHVLSSDGDVLAHRRELAVFASQGSPSVGAAMDPPYSFHFFADHLGRL